MARTSSDVDQAIRIRRTAARLFAKQGYHATGIQELSDAVGLGRGALYHYIGSKQRLLFEIVIERLIIAVEEAEALVARPLDAEQKVRGLSRLLMNTIASDLNEWTVFFRDGSSLQGSRRREVFAWRERFEATWVEATRQGAREHVFRELDAVAIKGILGMHNYGYMWLRPDGRLSADQVSETFCDMLLTGLRLPYT